MAHPDGFQPNTFMFFENYYRASEKLASTKDRESFFSGILAYYYDGIQVEMTAVAEALFLCVRAGIDGNITKQKNGALGGSNPKQSPTKGEPNPKQSPTKGEPNPKQREKEKEKEYSSSATTEEEGAGVAVDTTPYGQIQNAYEKTCLYLNPLASLTSKRKKTIRHLYEKYGMEDILQMLEKASNSDFLNGENDRLGKVGFDWIMKEEHFINILEGKYDNREKPSNQNRPPAPPANNDDLARLLENSKKEKGDTDAKPHHSHGAFDP